MEIKNCLLLCVCFIGLCFKDSRCKVVLDDNLVGSSLETLMMDPYVQVYGASNHFDFDQYDLLQFKFVETGKNKRKAYGRFIRKYNKIVECLVKNKIIPFEDYMIHSSIQMSFNARKKVWEFSRVFTIYSNQKNLEYVLQYLEPFKLINLKDRPLIGDINTQKLMIIEAFFVAKENLFKFIKNTLNSKFKIRSVVSMQIETQNVVRSNVGLVGSKSKNVDIGVLIKNKGIKQLENQLKSTQIKVVFEIGQDYRSDDYTLDDIEEQFQEDDNSSNESSFELQGQEERIIFQ